MTKLTETQLSLLAAADGRDDGSLTRPPSLRSATAAKTAAKLIEHRLVREIRAKADMPVWREEEGGRRFSLTLLKAGRAVVSAASRGAKGPASIEQHGAATANTLQHSAADPKLGRPGSKRALIVGLLQQPDGVTIKNLMAATGWLPHTTRAALTGLRKTGLAIDRRQGADMQGSVYRLASTKTTEAA